MKQYLFVLKGWTILLQLLRVLIIVFDFVILGFLFCNYTISDEIIACAKESTAYLPVFYIFIYWINREIQKTWFEMNSKPRD